VTIAIRPSFGTGWRSCRFDLGQAKTRIFLQEGLDRQIGDLPVGQITPSFMVLQGARTGWLRQHWLAWNIQHARPLRSVEKRSEATTSEVLLGRVRSIEGHMRLVSASGAASRRCSRQVCFAFNSRHQLDHMPSQLRRVGHPCTALQVKRLQSW
jgi:hypothetical protein